MEITLGYEESVMEGWRLRKLQSIMENTDLPLHQLLVQHRGTKTEKLRPPISRRQCHRRSFSAVAIKQYNSCLFVTLIYSPFSFSVS